jgi:hypothetical protein
MRQALTIRRSYASCGATGRLLQRFLDVSFQHSNWTLCNRDANLPWIHLWILNDRKNPMKTGVLKISCFAGLIPAATRTDICVGSKVKAT